MLHCQGLRVGRSAGRDRKRGRGEESVLGDRKRKGEGGELRSYNEISCWKWKLEDCGFAVCGLMSRANNEYPDSPNAEIPITVPDLLI